MSLSKTLRQKLQDGTVNGDYFVSDTPFFNGGYDWKLYRVSKEQPKETQWLRVIPARYDLSSRSFINLVPVDVFRGQRLEDIPFVEPVIQLVD